MIGAPAIMPLPALFVLALAVPLAAQESDEAQDTVTVTGSEGSGNAGRVAINLAAGNRNQQIGAAVIAMGAHPVAVASTVQTRDTSDPTDRATRITIGADAFSSNSGMLSVNIAAGSQNQSANLAVLAIATTGVVSDQMLAEASAPTRPAGSSAQGLDTPNDAIAIDGGAFAGNEGLVQVNLVGGERNSSANTFALSVSAGGEP